MANTSEDYMKLSSDDQDFLKKGGVIVRAHDAGCGSCIECISEANQFWHIHAACNDFENIESRDAKIIELLEFADYKLYK